LAKINARLFPHQVKRKQFETLNQKETFMALGMSQEIRQVQKHVMTTEMQQAIRMLQLSHLELLDEITQEMEQNPLLEEAGGLSEAGPDEKDESLLSQQKRDDGFNEEVPAALGGNEEQQLEVRAETGSDFDWDNYLDEYSSAPASRDSYFFEEREAPNYENFIAKPYSLKESLLWQLRMSSLNMDQMVLGSLIIGSLASDGYLRTSLPELLEQANQSGSHTFTSAEAEEVLKLVQRLDPLGVACQSLEECLLLQAIERYPACEVLHDLIEFYLDKLSSQSPAWLTRKLECGLNELEEALELLRTLNPAPGNQIDSEEPQYITPDIYVHKVGEDYVVELNEDGLPKLRISGLYSNNAALGSSEVKRYVQEKRRSAEWFIRAIYQRQRTIHKVTASIVRFQREFLDKGIAYLKPLVLRDIAEDVGMHESTISRATNQKYVHTPQGVFELKFFFNSSINRAGGDSLASEAVRDKIKKLIGGENPAKPLADQIIAEILQKENIDIARRTVAKYREMMGIPTSSRRRRKKF
jgi:RNA polymerase sigma-54 factor